MRTKFKIDSDSRVIVMRYVRKYDEYRKWYMNARENILYGSRRMPDGMPKGNRISDSVYEKTELLERLDNSHKKKVMTAIDDAKNRLMNCFESEEEGKRLADAILDSCINGRESNFDAYAGLIACERTAFYNYKSVFIEDIKEAIGI